MQTIGCKVYTASSVGSELLSQVYSMLEQVNPRGIRLPLKRIPFDVKEHFYLESFV